MERITQQIGDKVAARMHQVNAEEQAMRNLQENGSSGENYWVEAPSLSNPEVPPWIKDEIMQDMQRDRKPQSPANMTPLIPREP